MVMDVEENKFLELISKIPNVAVQGYNKEREVIYWNEASEKIYGYSKEEAFGRKLEDLIIPDFMRKDVVEFISNWYENGVAIPSSELELRKKDGSPAYVYSSHVMLGEGTDSPEMFCLDVDLSEQKKQKNDLKEKNRMLAQQSKMAQMGEMLGMIAHQWRQPLAAISATSVDLEMKIVLNGDKLDKETVLKAAQDISGYSSHLSATINDFRDFFKEDKQKETVILEEMALSVIDMIQAATISKKIQIITDFNCGAKYKTYANEVKQVLLNLITNAQDALFEKETKNPTITITTNRGTLVAKDNAGGVPKEIMDKVFEQSFSTKKDANGTGVGLYMSKLIIEERCGGKISVWNDDFGAVFKIILEPMDEEKILI